MNTIEKILDLMQKNSITAQKLTTDLELPNSAITEWRKGKSGISTNAIIKISEYFKVSSDWLLGLTDDPTPPSKKETFGKADEAVVAEILTKMRAGNPNRAVIMKYGGEKQHIIELSDEELEQVNLILDVMREKKKREEENGNKK